MSQYSKTEILNYAGMEWLELKNTSGTALMSGCLKCQCMKDIKAYGPFPTGLYKAYDDLYTFTDGDGVVHKDVVMCKEYIQDEIKAQGLNNGVKDIIVMLNYVIRLVVIKIINWVGCSTESTQMIYITNMVFICQFFNTGILPMLCTANLEGQLPPKIVNFFNLKGGSTDFNQNWFTNIGDTIAAAMIFNIIFPVGMEICWFMYRTFFRLLDRMGTDEENPSNSSTIQQYVNKHAGPLYYMHYKYSSILNIVFLTMMFGPGMPILFPVAMASLLVIYILENYMLYYVYKAPPAYDEMLNNHVLGILAWAPVLMLSFGYWMLTNLQLQQTYESLIPLQLKNDPFKAEHFWYDSVGFKGIFGHGPAGILLFVCFIYVVFLLLRKPIWAIVKAYPNVFQVSKLFLDDLPVNEDLGMFKDVLNKQDRKYSVAEEINCRLFGMQSMLEKSFISLQQTNALTKDRKMLTGVHTYDLLRNPMYIQQF